MMNIPVSNDTHKVLLRLRKQNDLKNHNEAVKFLISKSQDHFIQEETRHKFEEFRKKFNLDTNAAVSFLLEGFELLEKEAEENHEIQ